jgi:hypothetical protein
MSADEFPKVLKRYTRKKRGGAETVLCEEREYAEGDSNGQYQLWVWRDCKYVGPITRPVVQEKREEQEDREQYSVLAWPDLRPVYFDDNLGPNQTRNIASMLGRLRRETAFDRTEAGTWRNYFFGDDPQVAPLQTQLAIANSAIKVLEAQKAALQAKVTLLEFQLSKDPKVMEARRIQDNEAIQDRIEARIEKDRVKKEKELRERDELEKNNPELKKQRLRREQIDREMEAENDREARRLGLTEKFGQGPR